MAKVKTFNGGFAEIYGSGKGLRFSMLRAKGADFESYHGSTCCKDFFTDMFYGETMAKTTSIHGFQWKPGTLPAKAKSFTMGIEFEGQVLAPKAGLAQEFMNKWEERWGITPTEVSADETGKVLLFHFSAEWTTRPALISFVTMLMRVSLAYEGGGAVDHIAAIIQKGNPYGRYDKEELGKNGVLKEIMRLWIDRERPALKQTFKQYPEAYGAHHSGGFIAYTTGRATG